MTSIRGRWSTLTDSLLADLAKIFGTVGRAYIYIANGHGAWEAALTNVLTRGDKVLVLESGRFALGWGEYAPHARRRGGDPARRYSPRGATRRRSRRGSRPTRAGTIKAILVVQVDTASGVVNDIPAIGKRCARPAMTRC